MPDTDITRSIRLIEQLKSELLTNVADLHRGLLKPSGGEEIESALAGIVIKSYMLAKRLGISYPQLESKIVSDLRLALLEDENADSRELKKFFDKYR